MKTSTNVPEASQGIGAGKKTKGRKRHLITDTLGLVLAVHARTPSVGATVTATRSRCRARPQDRARSVVRWCGTPSP
ncbi:transposase [Streptomyces sp. NPDC059122]|uniref:transposase n=1 Tax=unclassified Streptomyces TaxID=2593676 RepID=UPI00369A4145